MQAQRAAVRRAGADWLSAQWEIQPIPGTEFVRLRNVWRPDVFLHTEAGYAQVGTILPGWHSAMWVVEPVAGTQFVRLRNRWMEGTYLNTESGQLAISGVAPHWWSAMWWTLQ